ncbi:Rcat domain-containing protein [Sphingobacterium chungjuense]|uniref:hypothetical protein n=1 Tax=Sphingobacterium chungjuense TaxID=2675553 RepID=UPI00140E5FD0|nr:hypothetical protein [Sphingobacterium chungjuense]
MAKRITALKCPQCGSVKKQSVKEDHYICNHCDTEYFLDNDDINVNVNHHHRGFERRGAQNTTKKNMAIIAVAIALIFYALISSILSNTTSSSDKSSGKDIYQDHVRDQMVYTGADGNPKILFSVERRYGAYSKKSDEYLLLFYDPIRGKIIQEQKPEAKWGDSPSLRYRKFADGNTYLIADGNNQLYRLDSEADKLLDVSAQIFGSKPEFAAGLATLKFTNDNYGDGLDIMTNDGKEFMYFPIPQKIYAERKLFFQDSEELSTLPSDAKIKKYYIFSEKSSSYPEEPIQLIQYDYQEKSGFPIRLPYGAEWKDVRDYRYSNNVTYKSVFSSHDKRVVSFKDLTPDRMYFKPTVMYQEENRLYIKTLPNANPENTALLQKIDTETGQVIWTYKPDAVKSEFSDLSVYKDGIGLYVYSFGSPRVRKFVLLGDQDGKPFKEIDLDNFKLN